MQPAPPRSAPPRCRVTKPSGSPSLPSCSECAPCGGHCQSPLLTPELSIETQTQRLKLHRLADALCAAHPVRLVVAIHCLTYGFACTTFWALSLLRHTSGPHAPFSGIVLAAGSATWCPSAQLSVLLSSYLQGAVRQYLELQQQAMRYQQQQQAAAAAAAAAAATAAQQQPDRLARPGSASGQPTAALHPSVQVCLASRWPPHGACLCAGCWAICGWRLTSCCALWVSSSGQ